MKNLIKILFLTILFPLMLFANSSTKDNSSNCILKLSSVNRTVFVGEPFDVTFLFKEKKSPSKATSKFFAPDFKGFWKKKETKPIKSTDSDYRITKIVYTVAAQRVGKLYIKPAKIKMPTRIHSESFILSSHPDSVWKLYFSNELSIDVKALPSGVDLIGDFTISATADKSEINSNEALNVLVTIKGKGNLEDIKILKPHIDGVSVFDEKIVITKSLLSQKMAFVADEDFTVPQFSIKYYDLKTKKIKTISTKEIRVKVTSSKAKKELTIKRHEKKKSVKAPPVSKLSISYFWFILIFALGLLFGSMITILKPWKIFLKDKSLDIKNHRLLLMKFLPFRRDEEVQKIVDIFEKNIYSNEKIQIDKKVLKEIIKKYDIG